MMVMIIIIIVDLYSMYFVTNVNRAQCARRKIGIGKISDGM